MNHWRNREGGEGGGAPSLRQACKFLFSSYDLEFSCHI